MSVLSHTRGFAWSEDAADASLREAEAISIHRIDEASAQVRPSNLGTSYLEQEYHARGDEQELLAPAKGEIEARPFQVEGRGLERSAAATEFLLAQAETEIREAHAEHQRAAQTLSPYVRRGPVEKLRYWIGWPILVVGDTAGVWSTAVVNGDIPYIAFGQALAAGLAAACAGLVGSELKDIRMAKARQRDPDNLTKEEQRYRRLFVPGNSGLGITKLIGFLSLLVAMLVAVGISTLRSSIEGSTAGLTFGLLAAGTALASGLLGYAAADEVADLLDTLRKRVVRAERRYLKLASSAPHRRRAEAEETARSIQAEHKLRGQAAAKVMESRSWQVQRTNPGVFGHGFAAGEQSGVIGRRARRNGGAA